MGLSQLEIDRPSHRVSDQGRCHTIQGNQLHHGCPLVCIQHPGCEVEHHQNHRQPHKPEQRHPLVPQKEQQAADCRPRQCDDQRVHGVGGCSAGQRKLPVQRLCQQGIQNPVDAEVQQGGEKACNGNGALPPVILVNE